jgi:NADPH-dependent glutamate synthase beta subunit-like oxidoreductase
MCARGRRDEANAVIREKVPFPGVLGRVCTHPCEDICRRGEVNESIAICALKRYAADGDQGLWKKENKIAAASGKKVAVVGAGPAGLTAAFYLRKKGHGVTVFDANPAAGGMLRYGIPPFRLPRDILDSEIADILALGIDFKAGRILGKDFILDQLTADGYDAVFLAIGARDSQTIPLEGGHNVIQGIEFLRRVAQGEDVRLKDNVVVIGGGNVAVDAAMTALRCGAADVKMVCLEGLDEMPARLPDLEAAKAEGIDILPSRGPGRVVSKEGNVTGLDLVECICVFDDRGVFCPQFGRTTECIAVDQVIIAVGQTTDLSFLKDGSPIKVDSGLITVEPKSLQTGASGIYAGGDVTAAAGTIIDAVAAGRRAASSIDQVLGGSGIIDEILFDRGPPDPFLGRDDGFAFWARENVPQLDSASRIQGFEEIAGGYLKEQAMREARRCLQCDLRLHLGSNPLPPEPWLPFDAEHLSRVPESEGVFQLLDAANNVVCIKGTDNLRRELIRALQDKQGATLFGYEEHQLYSQRESELLQKYLRQHGRMPGGEEDDLF